MVDIHVKVYDLAFASHHAFGKAMLATDKWSKIDSGRYTSEVYGLWASPVAGVKINVEGPLVTRHGGRWGDGYDLYECRHFPRIEDSRAVQRAADNGDAILYTNLQCWTNLITVFIVPDSRYAYYWSFHTATSAEREQVWKLVDGLMESVGGRALARYVGDRPPFGVRLLGP